MGLLFDLVAAIVFSASLAAGAFVSSLSCRRRSGFVPLGWKLLAVVGIANSRGPSLVQKPEASPGSAGPAPAPRWCANFPWARTSRPSHCLATV